MEPALIWLLFCAQPTAHIHVQLCTGGILCVCERDETAPLTMTVCVSLDFQPTDKHRTGNGSVSVDFVYGRAAFSYIELEPTMPYGGLLHSTECRNERLNCQCSACIVLDCILPRK